MTEKLPSEAENLQTAITRLQTALNKAYQYVDDVVVSGAWQSVLPASGCLVRLLLLGGADSARCGGHRSVCAPALQSGRRKGDINVGRYLADTCAAVPYIRKEDFEQLLQDNTQDAMLVMYLANLVRAHVALADKLGTAALPIL